MEFDAGVGAAYLYTQVAQRMREVGVYHHDLRGAVARAVAVLDDQGIARELEGVAYVVDVDYGTGDDRPDREAHIAAMYVTQAIAARLRAR